MGLDLLEKRFTDFETDRPGYKEVKEYAEKFARDTGVAFNNHKQRPKGFTLLGPAGTGKSMLSACVANKLMDEYGVGCVMNMASLLIPTMASLVHEEGMSQYDTRMKAIKYLCLMPVVIIDDIGREKSSSSAVNDRLVQDLFFILNDRYVNRMPIIVTSNLTQKELEAYLGDASYDRLMAMTKPFVLYGESYRLTKPWLPEERGQRL